MIDQDFDAFAVETRRVATIFRFRATPVELTQITQAYFKAFRRRPLSSVIAGADAWIAKGDHFPKPAQWLGLMPQREHAPTMLALTRDESDDWLQAERQRWEGRPCRCECCVAADVADRALRFVPDVESDGQEARALIGDRTITRGHWAHGEELVRWYQAKATFWTLFRPTVRAHTFPQTTGSHQRKRTVQERIAAVFTKPTPAPMVEREPGEDG